MILRAFFFENWQRKIISLLSACLIWLVIHNSITTTKTFTDVPVRILNGILPSGVLDKRIAVTLSGNTSVVSELQEHDLEIVINAAGKEDQWVAKEVKQLQEKGLKLTLNANKHENWKKMPLPFQNDSGEEIYDPETKFLRIDFLKRVDNGS